MKGMTIKMSGEITKGTKKCRMTKAPYNLKLPSWWAPDDGDQREFDLETRVTTNENMIISEMFHSCALNK